MQELSLIVFFIISFFMPPSDSPHGKNLDLSCSECHTSDGWKVNSSDIPFNHNKDTDFKLKGSHDGVNCVTCHPTLVFSAAKQECISCHTDMHQETVGVDCARCHTTNDWIVTNITEIHQESRFPLLGAHNTADCDACHKSSSLLLFEPLGVECVDCHLDKYEATTSPNHIENDYSTDCYECHKMNAFSWTGTNYTHSFFPLVDGHAIGDCAKCHTDPKDYSNISPECFSCHETDYNAAKIPDHVQSGLSTTCTDCHTLSVDWRPADFSEHDVLFPIYSGSHQGQWNSCADCHNNPDNISVFTCIDCHDHNKGEMDDKHSGIGGYVYTSPACFECHPTGSKDGFNHNLSNFPLTGAHITTDCEACHSSGYSGTPTICVECHRDNYNETSNPNHTEIGIVTECETCHTTEPGWTPALFEQHNDYYVLTGEHITTSCADCHINGYDQTPNVCFDCHYQVYNETTDPNHIELGFPNTCDECHTTNANWTPSTYDHNSFYPLTGAHTTTSCSSCHINGYPGTPSNCVDCHIDNFNQSTNPNHTDAGFATECQTCHTTNPGWTPTTYTHDFYPLTGGHSTTSCNNCHQNGYSGTSSNCVDCHIDDFNQATNPNHVDAGFPNDCQQCHTTNPGWTPTTFNHDDYYQLNGAHALIANDCYACHQGDYTNTPNTCFGCHEDNYNQTTNPPHQSAQFSTECTLCHTESAWVPSTFDHDNQYFPIYSGKHQGEWSTCSECHTDPSNYSSFSCIDCHKHNKADTDDKHRDVSNYVYNSDACFDCHPDGSQKFHGLYYEFNKPIER